MAEARIGKYNLGTRAGKWIIHGQGKLGAKLEARAGKYKLESRAGKYRLRAGVRETQRPGFFTVIDHMLLLHSKL